MCGIEMDVYCAVVIGLWPMQCSALRGTDCHTSVRYFVAMTVVFDTLSADFGAASYQVTMSLRGAWLKAVRRGNLQHRGSNMFRPINIEYLGFSMLIRFLLHPSAMQEIATSGLCPSSQ